MLKYLRGSGKHTKTIWWVLTIVTVVTFLGGFVFIFGSGLGSGSRARATGAVAVVNGDPVTRAEFQDAVGSQRAGYLQRFGDEPSERDMRSLEAQAFRALVLQLALNQKAHELGLQAHDREVYLTLQTSPPPEVMNVPAFRSNGQFDIEKYRAALRDPGNNWSAFEERVRSQLPSRKLQERLFTSVKLTEPQLRQAYRDQNERVSATLLTLRPETTAPLPNVSDADLQRTYDKYKSRFWSGPQRELEVLLAPKQFGDAEVKAAQDLAASLAQRLRRGENFMDLSRQYSDAPGADRGGIVDRVLSPSDFGPQLGPKVALMDTGQVTDPVRDGGRFMFFKVLGKAPNPSTGAPGVKVAEFMIRVKANEDRLRAQYESLTRLRAQARREGLGRAAVTQGLSTTKTGLFDPGNPPTQLSAVPQAADWAVGAKLNEVSPVLDGLDFYAIVQLVGSKEAGPSTREQLGATLRQVAQLDGALDAMKPRVDALEAAVKSGRTLEQAAAGLGLQVEKIEGLTRAQGDPRLSGAPELVGKLFGVQPGQVVGPVRGINGYFVARLDQRTQPDWSALDAQRQQLSQQLLENMQRQFLENYTAAIRLAAKVKDLRSDTGY